MASNKHAYGFCDRTGFRYPLKDLVPQYRDRKRTGLLVGRDMLDKDHEQLRLSEVIANDKISLDNPRPDQALVSSRGLSAWNPVGGGVTALGSRTVGLTMECQVGMVTVS